VSVEEIFKEQKGGGGKGGGGGGGGERRRKEEQVVRSRISISEICLSALRSATLMLAINLFVAPCTVRQSK